jgi:hypothetical protein
LGTLGTLENLIFTKAISENQLDAIVMVWDYTSWLHLPLRWPTPFRVHVIATLKSEKLLTHIFPEKVPKLSNGCHQWAVKGCRLWMGS